MISDADVLAWLRVFYAEAEAKTLSWSRPTREIPNPPQTRDSAIHLISILEKKTRPIA